MTLKNAEGVESLVSVSGDCIYAPGTQVTRHTIRHEAKRTLERRMPGFEISISDVNGIGLNFYASCSIPVGTDVVEIRAVCFANVSTMSVKYVDIVQNGKLRTVSPTLNDIMPEDAYLALHRIANNLYHYE